MRSKVFWGMERNLHRVRAEGELRHLRIVNAAQSKENVEAVSEHLAKEIGETAQIQRQAIVKAEPDAKAKFLRAMRG